RNRALQKGRKASERGLPVLILRQIIVVLNALDPETRINAMNPAREIEVIFVSEQIADRRQVAPGVRPRLCDLRCSVERRPPADHNSSDRRALHPTGNIYWSLAREIIRRARVSYSSRIQSRGRKHMRLLETCHLFPECLEDTTQRIRRGSM